MNAQCIKRSAEHPIQAIAMLQATFRCQIEKRTCDAHDNGGFHLMLNPVVPILSIKKVVLA